jgi:thiamine-phosphate pyrophosphorylase
MSQPICRLYLITPPVLADLEAFAITLDAALAVGDVAALQLRLKPANPGVIKAAVARLMPIAHAHGVALILNDDPQLAQELGCDGVHLGQSDMPLAQARRLLGPEAMIGVTCHDSRHLAMEAAEGGADYVAFGAFFPTQTKDTPYLCDPDILNVWQESMQTPCVAIGGITPQNAAPLVAAGADFLAVSAGIWQHPQGPDSAVAAFNQLFRSV